MIASGIEVDSTEDAMKIEYVHVCFEVKNYETAMRFYSPLFEVTGFRSIMTDGKSYGGFNNGIATVWVGESQPRRVVKGIPTGEEFVIMDHLGFTVSSRAEVDSIAAAMQKAGFTPLFPAQEYPEFGEGFYAVTFCDADNNVIEFGYR